MSLHFLNIMNKVDEPEAPLLLGLVHLAEVLLELLKHLIPLGHVVRDRGQGQGQEDQDQDLLHRHLVIE